MTAYRPAARARFRAIQVMLLVTILSHIAKAQSEVPMARVRSSDPELALLVDRAVTLSVTFQRIVTAIQRSNGVVYVEPGKCNHGVHACLPIWMQTAGSNRFLRILIDRRKTDSDVDVMASVGHELQHAAEALSESGVLDGPRLYHFFSRVARSNGQRFETRTAIAAGEDIRMELLRSSRENQRVEEVDRVAGRTRAE